MILIKFTLPPSEWHSKALDRLKDALATIYVALTFIVYGAGVAWMIHRARG